MKRFSTILVTLATIIGLSLAVVSPALAWGEVGAGHGVDAAKGTGVPTNLANGDGSLVRKIVNVMLWIIGVISVIMLIFGGLRYVISGGQKEAVTSAKNTILYAIVGLLVALFAWAIVRFVLDVTLGTGGGTDI